MNKLLLTLTAALAGTAAMAQEAPTAQPASSSTSCLIVKHKGTVGRRLMYTALIGVPIAPGCSPSGQSSEPTSKLLLGPTEGTR